MNAIDHERNKLRLDALRRRDMHAAWLIAFGLIAAFLAVACATLAMRAC